MRDDAKNFSRGLLAVIVGVGTLSLLSALLITMYESHEVGTLRAVPGSGPALSTDFKGPMLEQAEGEVLARVRANEEKMLHEYGWVDRGQGVARVPIEVAMRALASKSATAAQGGTP